MLEEEITPSPFAFRKLVEPETTPSIFNFSLIPSLKCAEPVSILIDTAPTNPPPDKPPPGVGVTCVISPEPASIILPSTYDFTAPAEPNTFGLPSSIEDDT